jgi:hypothetical protein
MAFFIDCTKCGAKLRTANRLPAGRRVTCAVCERAFTTIAAAEPDGKGKRSSDDDEIRDAELLDDEADDAPRSKRRKQTEDDDRPRSRRRRNDDEPTRQPRKRNAPALLVGMGLGAFVLLLVVGVFIYFRTRDSGKPASSDMFAYAPSDAVLLAGYDLDDLARNDAFRKSLERRAPPDLVELDRAGLRTVDLSRVLIARTANNGHTCAVRFKTAPEKSKYLQANLSGKTYAPFISAAGNYKFGYFADDKTLVLADKEPAIQALLEKGKTKFSGDLQNMVDRVRGPVWRASGRLRSADLERIGPNDDGFSLRVGPSAGTAAWLVPDGRQADVRFELEFENAGQAKQAVATLKSAFLLQRSTNDLGQLIMREGTDPSDASDIRLGYQNADVSDDGPRVSAKLRLPASEAMRAVGSARN